MIRQREVKGQQFGEEIIQLFHDHLCRKPQNFHKAVGTNQQVTLHRNQHTDVELCGRDRACKMTPTAGSSQKTHPGWIQVHWEVTRTAWPW